jgi:hypothetical protein
LHVAYGRVEISGSINHLCDATGETPYYSRDDNPRITATLSKSPEQIAADITRRVLPGYRVVLADVLNQVAESNAHLSATAAIAAKVAEAIGARPDDNGRVDFCRSEAFPEDRSCAQCNEESVSLHLIHLTVAEACTLLAQLKCCRGK